MCSQWIIHHNMSYRRPGKQTKKKKCYDGLLLNIFTNNCRMCAPCKNRAIGFYIWENLQDDIMQFSMLEKQKATSILISHPALLHSSQAAIVISSRLCMATLSAPVCSLLHSARALCIGCSHKPLTGLAARRAFCSALDSSSSHFALH